MQERELLVMRGYRNVATVRRQYFVYKQAFESQLIQINLSDDGAREGAFGITLRDVCCMRRGGSGSRLGEMLQEQLTEMLGLSHRRGKFPDYLSFEQLKQTRNAWNKVIFCGDNWELR